MLGLIRLIFGLVVDLFRSRAALEAEILVLRQQIIVLRRGKPTRLPFMAADRLVLGLGLPAVSERSRRARHRTAGDRSALASRGLSILLALEVETPAGTSGRTSGDPPVDPRDEHCQSVVGSAADSRRTAQARDRCRADQRRQVHGRGGGDLRRRGGRRFFAIMRTASPRWTCSWCRLSRSGCSMGS